MKRNSLKPRWYDGWRITAIVDGDKVYTMTKMYEKPHTTSELSHYSDKPYENMWWSIHEDSLDIQWMFEYHRSPVHPVYKGTEEDWF